MAAASRAAFSVLAVPVQQKFGLSHLEMGLLPSTLLAGYALGQIPSGLLADRLGGIRVLTAALAAWSLAGAALAGAPAAASPLRYMLAARAALGLAQSALMPGVSAAAAQWFPPAQRGRRISSVYACFSVGTVAGLALTPALAAAAGWPAAFAVLGGCGAASAVAAWGALPPGRGGDAAAAEGDASNPGLAGGANAPRSRAVLVWPDGGTAAGVALLCWTHAVIGVGFFVLQAWIPTFLHSLGVSRLPVVGALSALPWLATAAVSVAAGRAADWLQASRGWTALRVRRAMQASANLLGAAALLPLAAAPPPGAAAAVACLTAAVAAQGLNYAGFHAYVQDVAPRDAGLILGLTNTCSTLAGAAGNLATGQLMQAAGMGGVFASTAALYAAGAASWALWARGVPLRLTRTEAAPSV